ncbi:MAG: M28 family peptidase [Hymenobacteraceae bacterium]|nr:M28 family peptidase [Hymenobacteraceae bacterium]MDX5396500.1 M28 family peptidase [Hymenobacteraceae bacterium]MDX5443729.1 M28 family peptidase [Hymenobacteraceae bacterium]MDX5512564.1 M28 family peptidase [Hymenobacteraceae bacterium]
MRTTLILLFLLFCSQSHSIASAQTDTTLLKDHLTALTKTDQYRNHQNVAQLNKSAAYIRSVFEQYSDSVTYQTYSVNGQEYKNVICSFGTENTKRIIIGAHYDVCGNQEGADDNASGVAGLLELARLLKKQKLPYRVDLVAYTLEEPPYFRTDLMGSYIHAKSLALAQADVMGMISLEMIGYFKDEKNTQDYPVGSLKLFYGSRGNYITLINKFGAGKFARKFSRKFVATNALETKKFVGPKALPGIDFSDHLNYWKFGYSALMITDTAFYRNKNYHKLTDTLATLDFNRMAKVVDGVYLAIMAM